MTKSSEVRIADAVASLTARLEAWSVDDAATKAHQFVRDMLANGWRTTKAELDLPRPVVPGDSKAGAELARAELARAKGVA